MLLGIFMLGSCTKEMQDVRLPASEDEAQRFAGSKYERLYAVKKPTRGGSGAMVPQAVAVTSKLWTHKATIKIKFLNGNQDIRDKVMQYGAEWLDYINLSFEYVADTDSADVKIGFNYEGEDEEYPFVSWVTIGTDCKDIEQDEASINLVDATDENGNVIDDPEYDSFVRADILRAYGAMLGLGFEHQSPNSTVTFINHQTTQNRRKLEGHFGVGIQQIIDEIITLYTTEQTKYTAYDSTSIMVLPLPGSILTDPRWGTNGNPNLSETDKCFIAALYPKTFDIEWVCEAFGFGGGFLCTDANDNLYFFQKIGTVRKLMKMDTQGVITELFTVPSQYYFATDAADVVVDDSGIVYLRNNGNLWQFSSDGTLLKTFSRQLSSVYVEFGEAMGVLDNNQLIYVAGLSNVPNPGSSYDAIWAYRYNSGTDASIPITELPYNPPLPLNNYARVAVSINNLVYMRLSTWDWLIKLDTDAGTYSQFTPAYAADDISNAAVISDGDPRIVGLSASRDIADITFLRYGFYEISPDCGQRRDFLFTYNPNCDSSCEVRNLGMLPESITKPDNTIINNIGYSFTASTRNGRITYVLSESNLYKITNHR